MSYENANFRMLNAYFKFGVLILLSTQIKECLKNYFIFVIV